MHALHFITQFEWLIMKNNYHLIKNQKKVALNVSLIKILTY